MSVKRKEIVTTKLIEQDIIQSLKKPKEQSKASYKKATVPGVIIGGTLVIVSFFRPLFGLYGLLALLPIVFIAAAIESARRRHKRNHVSMEDYTVTTGVLSHKDDESYAETRGVRNRRHHRVVNNYNFHFENGESWRLPEDNYVWSEERRMSNAFLYENAHRGDDYIVVTEKDTGKIAMVYPAAFFEYQAG